MTALLELSGLGKRFGEVQALRDVSMTVKTGTVHCVLGENGAGKSTLCNLTYGGYAPSTGRMELRGQPFAPSSPADALARGVAMVHQHFSLVPTMTVQQNLLLGGRGLRLRTAALTERLDRIEAEFGLRLDPKARVSDMPVGARQKVEIVKALLPDPDLLLLDEPTAVLDAAEIDALIRTCQAVAASGRAVVLVTHKLGEVARVADTATVLRGGTIAGGGALSEVGIPRLLAMMIGRDATDLDPALAAEMGITTTPPNTAGGSDAAGPDAAASSRHARRAPTASTSDRATLTVTAATVIRPDGTNALEGADLQLWPGEIVGIAGVEGNGQTELLHVLSGAARPDSGHVVLDDTDITTATPARRTALGVGVVPEDRHHEAMVGDLSVAENLYLSDLGRYRRRGVLRRAEMDTAAEKVIAAYGIRTAGPRAPMRTLSGGNQQKVVLARELAIEGLRVLIAAQPTRGLDIGAVDHVLARLRDAAAAGVAVLVISSEVPELLALCDRVLVSYRGRLLGPVDTTSPTAGTDIGALMTGTAA